jgi:hypothetical protein
MQQLLEKKERMKERREREKERAKDRRKTQERARARERVKERMRMKEKLKTKMALKEKMRQKVEDSKHKRAVVRIPLKAKRRSSMRLKTLAKVLGRSRPNYSLLVSGYADMEEYEEEQKKKAAKTALAKAKAEARAKAQARTGRARSSQSPQKPSKMRTRSTSSVGRDMDDSKSGQADSDRRLSEADRDRSSLRRDARPTQAEQDRTTRDRVDKEKADRDRNGERRERLLKRSLSNSSSTSGRSRVQEQKDSAVDLSAKRPRREPGVEMDRRSSTSSVEPPSSSASTISLRESPASRRSGLATKVQLKKGMYMGFLSNTCEKGSAGVIFWSGNISGFQFVLNNMRQW